jgi:hypothetical protein
MVERKKELAVAILDVGVAGWWLCWRLVVELLVEELTTRSSWLRAQWRRRKT